MKPVFLKIEGLNSFTSPQTVDFCQLGSANIFCITGPTGSGKTTILDAILLALYGEGSRGTQAEYINLSMDRASVEFTFDVEERGQPRRLTVTREFFRSAGRGARVRLTGESGETVCEQREVNQKLTELIGLKRDDFTQVVILEQGKFSRFLTGKKSERIRTVSKLFKLDRYDELYKKFNEQRSAAQNRLDVIAARLEPLESVTEEKIRLLKASLARDKKSLTEAETRLAEVEKSRTALAVNKGLFETYRKAEQELPGVRERAESLKTALAAAIERVSLLSARSADVESAKEAVAAARVLSGKLSGLKGKQEQLTNQLRERENLRKRYREARAALDGLRAQIETKKSGLSVILSKLAGTSSDSVLLSAGAESADFVAAAERMLSGARRANAAAAASEGLQKGDTCPVCGGVINEIAEGAGDLSAADGALASLKETIHQLDLDAEKFRSLEAEGKNRSDIIAGLERELAAADGDASAAAEKNEAEIKRLDRLISQHEEAVKSAEKEKTELQLASAQNNERLSALEKTLAVRPDYDESRQKALDAEAAVLSGEKSRLAAAIALSERELIGSKTGIAEKKKLHGQKREISALRDRLDVLCRLTKNSEFLDFVAEEYIADFTAAASDKMSELSGGKFTLEYAGEAGEFFVRDFLRGNERRKVKTLSGGETFLASLSMAVAISREIARFKNFEFFFLDEGFGTLHEGAIDTVAAALYALSRDTMVGVVTHRSELVERIAGRVDVLPATADEGSKIIPR